MFVPRWRRYDIRYSSPTRLRAAADIDNYIDVENDGPEYPPLDADDTLWGDRHFETQVQARCGLHALNNLLGGPCFDDATLAQACAQVIAITDEPQHEHRKTGGWYSHSVLSAALENIFPPFCRLLISPVSPFAYNEILNDADTFGALVNHNQAHWTAIIKHSGRLWDVDSQRAPTLLSANIFAELVAAYPLTLLVVGNDYVE